MAILRELLCASVSDRRLAVALERHVIGTVIRPFAEEDQSTDAYPRARLAFAALLGLAVSRYVLRQEPLASADHETLAAWMGPVARPLPARQARRGHDGPGEAEHDKGRSGRASGGGRAMVGGDLEDRVTRAVSVAAYGRCRKRGDPSGSGIGRDGFVDSVVRRRLLRLRAAVARRSGSRVRAPSRGRCSPRAPRRCRGRWRGRGRSSPWPRPRHRPRTTHRPRSPSAWKNGSKTCSATSGDMPDAVV